MAKKAASKKDQPLTTAQRLGSLVKSARDIMRKDKGLNGDLDRLPMLTSVMSLKFLDDQEKIEEERAKLKRQKFRPVIESPYRWRDWAAKEDGISGDALRLFINNDEASRLEMFLMSSFREIAGGVEERPLEEIAPLTRRPAEISLEAEYPGISARSFGRGTFHNPSLLGSDITWQKPCEVKARDILFSNIKSWEGAIAVVSPEDDGRFESHRYLTFAPKDGVATPRYVCFFLLSPEGLHYVGEASPGSADRNRTTGSRAMQAIPVPVPSYDAQLWFDGLFEKANEAKQVIEQARVERAALLPSILNEIFTGVGDG